MDDLDYSDLYALAIRLRGSVVEAMQEAEAWLDDARGTKFSDEDWFVRANKVLADANKL